jgi:Domain of unknown function (DUF4352)
MQQIATVTSNGAAVTYDNGVFAVGTDRVGIEKVVEYDNLGILTWANEETKAWAYQAAAASAAAPAAPQPAAAAPRSTPEKLKKAWYKKWWVWAIAVVVVIAAISGSGGSKSTTTTTSPSSPAASTPAEQPAAQTAAATAETPAADQATKIGSPLKVGDLTFTVSDAKATTKLTSVFGKKTGDWILVSATVQNGSKDAVLIDSSFFKLLAADGSTYETDSDNVMYLDNDKNFFLAKINPNLSKKGQVLFAVPAGSKPQDFKLQVQTGAFGTQTGEIVLSK